MSTVACGLFIMIGLMFVAEAIVKAAQILKREIK